MLIVSPSKEFQKNDGVGGGAQVDVFLLHGDCNVNTPIFVIEAISKNEVAVLVTF